MVKITNETLPMSDEAVNPRALRVLEDLAVQKGDIYGMTSVLWGEATTSESQRVSTILEWQRYSTVANLVLPRHRDKRFSRVILCLCFATYLQMR